MHILVHTKNGTKKLCERRALVPYRVHSFEVLGLAVFVLEKPLTGCEQLLRPSGLPSSYTQASASPSNAKLAVLGSDLALDQVDRSYCHISPLARGLSPLSRPKWHVLTEPKLHWIQNFTGRHAPTTFREKWPLEPVLRSV
jgi:hypothetical protein